MRRLGAIQTSFGPFAQRAFSAAEIHVRAGAYIFRRGLDVCLAWELGSSLNFEQGLDWKGQPCIDGAGPSASKRSLARFKKPCQLIPP
jgi:hypothetical protein